MLRTTEEVYDCDGIWVPPNWALVAWERQPLHWRQKTSIDRRRDYEAKLVKEEKRTQRVHRDNGPDFSTDYAIAWGRAQGWRLVERERYDFRTKKKRDCMFATDAIMRLPSGKLVGIQGAGRSQRTDHRRKFDQYGTGPYGAELAMAQGIEIWYLEFDRNNSDPVLVEKWA
jgi:hypothetical protein